MKKILTFILPVILLVGCQQEISDTWQPQPDEVIQSGGSLSGLIQAMTTKDGSADNIIDMSSCVSIKLPITVKVNGQELVIETVADFEEVEKILDRYDDDEDQVEISFPITVVFPDHTEYVVDDQDELDDIIENCESNIEDIDIECIDIKYPISVSIYNTANQIAQVIEINSDDELYRFIDDLDDEDIVSINFPVTVILSDGTELVIADNQELEDIIDESADTCDEDDDNDFDDDDVDDQEIIQVLINGTWEVAEFFDGQDKTELYSAYKFGFFEEELAVATSDTEQFFGEWEVYGDAGYLEFELGFDGVALLDDLELDWEVESFNDEEIALFIEDESTEYRLVFSRSGDSEPVTAVTDLEAILSNEVWSVASFTDSGEDITSDFNDYDLQFEEDGTLIASTSDEEFTGTWTIEIDDSQLVLIIELGTASPLGELTDDWYVVESSDTRIELIDNIQGEGEALLVLESI